MFAGGIRALLLQSLHPLAMAGVAAHSGFKGDPWGRLQRTSHFLAVTSFGRTEDAEAMVRAIRAVHATVVGTAPDGRPTPPPTRTCCAGCTSPRSTASCAATSATAPARSTRTGATATSPRRPGSPRRSARSTRRGPRPSSTTSCRVPARARGHPGGPGDRAVPAANPPLPLLARPPYAALSAAAVSLLPRWARHELALPYLPLTEAVVVRAAGEAVTRTIRWAMIPPR